MLNAVNLHVFLAFGINFYGFFTNTASQCVNHEFFLSYSGVVLEAFFANFTNLRKMQLRKMLHLLYVMKFLSEIIDKTIKKLKEDSGCLRALQIVVLTVIIRQCASTKS